MAGFDQTKTFDTVMPPLAGVSAVGANNAPAAHYGSGIVLGVMREPGKGPQLWIRMDDGGENFESYAWIEIPGEQQEERFVGLAKAKYRAILEALDSGQGTAWLPADWLNANATKLSMLTGRRIHYGFVPRNTDGGKYDEYQFMSPEKCILARQQNLVPARTAYSKDRGETGTAATPAGVVAPPTAAAPPPGVSAASPPAAVAPPALTPPAAVAPPALTQPPAATMPPNVSSGLPPGMQGFAAPPS